MSKDTELNNMTEADFSQFMLQDTGEVAFKDPKGKPLLFNKKPVSAIVYGPATKQHRVAYTTRIQALAKIARGSQGENEGLSAEEQSEQQTQLTIDFLIAVTKEFKNFPYPGGVPRILNKPEFKYFADQILNFLDNEGNFFAGGQNG